MLGTTCHSLLLIRDWYFFSLSVFLCWKYSKLDSYGHVTSMMTQCPSSLTIVMSGLTNSISCWQVLSICALLPELLIFNSFVILLTNLLSLSWIIFLFALHLQRICWLSSTSNQHLWHFFSSISVCPLVLLTIVGKADNRYCMYLTSLPVFRPLSNHSQSLGC